MLWPLPVQITKQPFVAVQDAITVKGSKDVLNWRALIIVLPHCCRLTGRQVCRIPLSSAAN